MLGSSSVCVTTFLDRAVRAVLCVHIAAYQVQALADVVPIVLLGSSSEVYSTGREGHVETESIDHVAHVGGAFVAQREMMGQAFVHSRGMKIAAVCVHCNTHFCVTVHSCAFSPSTARGVRMWRHAC